MGKVVNIHEGHRARMKKRFLKEGFENFAVHEILEMMLYPIIPLKNTNDIAHDLLRRFGSLFGVLNASVEELVKIKNISESGAVYLKSLAEFFKAYRRESLSSKKKIVGFKDVLDFCQPLLENSSVEELYVICLDNQKNILTVHHMGKGTVVRVSVSIREIVTHALSVSATGIVIAHSHPNGIPHPSSQDIQFTKSLYNSLMSIDILLLEHIIISGNEHYSFFKEGLLVKAREEYIEEFNPTVMAQTTEDLQI